MTSTLATIGALWVAWISFALATSLIITFAYPAAAGWLRKAHPRPRAALARAAALAPSIVPTLLLLACLAPSMGGAFGRQGDHCLHHADHLHLCLIHRTGALDAPLGTALLFGSVALAFMLARSSAKLGQSRRTADALRSLAQPDSVGGLRVLNSATPFCFATGHSGGAGGEIWISSALSEGLSQAELDVVLAHEHAHLDRRDAGWRVAAEFLSFPLFPGLRRVILEDEALAAEQACDEAAGLRVGDRLRVAETLLAVERLSGASASSSPPGWPAFGGSSVATRVRSLLAEPPPDRSWTAASGLGAALVGGSLLLFSDSLHHWTEHWLRMVL